jgi:2-polyprenyl-6-methoxyphenol hydroxylase-like FAD-dependent oxidoreductase
MRVAINGAGIAGSTLAWWLQRSGHEVLLVEQAPQLRRGGYVIDFWGLGYDIAEKMGLMPELLALGYQVREVRFVDRDGGTRGGFDADVFGRMTGGRFTSLRRSDLAAAIYGAVEGKVETLFGDSLARIEPRAAGLRIGFEHAGPREVDLVVGADGLHSRVRELLFGPQAQFEVGLGYHVAAFELAGYRPRDERVYVSHAVPGRQVSRFAMRGDRTLFLLVFRDETMGGPAPRDDAGRKALLRRVFAEVRWECPRLLEALDGIDELYFDRVGQIRMDAWSKGRGVLLGDAAACVSLLAGEGTGLAMAQAYVLAGELRRNPGDPAAALYGYQALMRPFLRGKQRSAAKFASAFAPRTAAGVGFRNLVTRLLRIPAVADYFIGRDLRDSIRLPDYAC